MNINNLVMVLDLIEDDFSFGDGVGQNVIIFGADMKGYVHANNKTKNILVLGKGFMQELDNTTIYAENFYSTFFNLSYVNSLECVSMSNQGCKARPKIINVNSNEPVFYPCSIKVNKCSGICNNINDPYAKLGGPDIIKNINVKVFNLISRINETRSIIWHETCKCVCRLTSAICNSRQIWNEDRRRCECKEDLIDKRICDKGYIWNPSNWGCECDKSCGRGEYLEVIKEYL